jgi:hypothetical protein
MALAGVSSPTALPMRACLVGKLDNITTTRRWAGGVWRSFAWRIASSATRSQRSGSAA